MQDGCHIGFAGTSEELKSGVNHRIHRQIPFTDPMGDALTLTCHRVEILNSNNL